MKLFSAFDRTNLFFTVFAMVFLLAVPSTPAFAQVTAFKQAVAEASAKDADIAEYYKATDYEPIWTGTDGRDRTRRSELLNALKTSGEHGLPTPRYAIDVLEAKIRATRDERARGFLEVELTQVFLQYARDLQTGALTPRKIDAGLVMEVPYRSRESYLSSFVKNSPGGFFRALAPQSPEYTRLMKEKITLERVLGDGGWGQEVPGNSLKPGQTGDDVVVLRNRLMAMGYLKRSASQAYDASLQEAVQQFQMDHGLDADGVAGAGTIAEINVPVEARLQSIIVSMERERWLNMPRGKRHIMVNLTDFSAKIIDDDKVTFSTRSVVGADDPDRRSPEFSDMMEVMVINPSWNVPRSITVKEYLPMMKRNPNAAGHLKLIDSRGRTVPRSQVDFSRYTAGNFPYAMKQPPSDGNALGLVKFLFPNKYNIYLHDTPSKSLFNRETRAFSHGCIRLQEPFEFAYALLAKQTDDPVGLFQSHLRTRSESVIALEQQVPVHLTYRTAFTEAKGRTQYRRDVYGRDARIWQALAKAGVALRAVQG